MLKILILEGNTMESRAEAAAAGLEAQSDLYRRTLESLADNVICTIAYPADEDAALPDTERLDAYDGVVWTGSALNIYDGGPAVERQIDLMRRCLGHASRMFGSCWGLEVAVVAAGGEVAANAKGREIGIARDIRLTEAGRAHPMYRGKPAIFDAAAVHLDHAVRLPPGTEVLAGNDMSEVQALELRSGDAVFWGVQYHPEFDLDYMARLVRRYGRALVEEGICGDDADVEKWAADLAALQAGEGGDALRHRYGAGRDVLDPRCRLIELSNWLSVLQTETAEA